MLMAKNLAKICDDSRSLILVCTGVVHSRKFTLSENKKTLTTILNDEFIIKNSFIRYKSGTVQLEDEIYNVKNFEQQALGPGNDFDFEIIVNKAHHATNEDLLATIADLCIT